MWRKEKPTEIIIDVDNVMQRIALNSVAHMENLIAFVTNEANKAINDPDTPDEMKEELNTKLAKLIELVREMNQKDLDKIKTSLEE